MCDVLLMDVIKVHAKFSPIASRQYSQSLHPDGCILPPDGYSLPPDGYILCLDGCRQRWVSGAVVRASDFQAGGPQFEYHCRNNNKIEPLDRIKCNQHKSTARGK